MNSKIPPSPSADLEWTLQERAREDERNRTTVGNAAQLNRYRLISRVLSEPLREALPHDFAATIAAASESSSRRRFPGPLPQLRTILILIGAAYLAAMTTAALLMGLDLRHSVAAFDGSIIAMTLSVALSQAVVRTAGLIRLVRSPLQ